MTASSKKTVSILCAAGGLIAAAITLGNRSTATAGRHELTPTPTSPVLLAKEPVAPACAAGPASTEQDLGFGTMRAGLSHGKILRGGGNDVFAAIDLGARESAATVRPPLNIALVVDRSGSMDGDKMKRAKEAALALVEGMGASDRLALVQYDDSVDVLVSSVVTDAEGKRRLRSAIRGISTRGSTNLHGGMIRGRDELKRALGPGQVSRVILLSDGLANVGVTDPVRIADDARRAADQGLRLTTIGMGTDYNEDLMEAIAEAGRGHYYYVKDAATLEKVLAGEWKSMQSTVATAVELRLEAACAGVEIAEVLGYESRREGSTVVVPMADIFGGDARKLVVKLKVPDGMEGAFGAVRAELVYTDAKTAAKKTVAVRLGVEVTSDLAAVEGSVDKDVMGYVLQVEAAQTMRQAAKAYESGDVAGARGMLGKAKMKAQRQAAKYDIAAEASAPALDNLDAFDDEVKNNAPGSVGAKDALKTRKSSARTLAK